MHQPAEGPVGRRGPNPLRTGAHSTYTRLVTPSWHPGRMEFWNIASSLIVATATLAYVVVTWLTLRTLREQAAIAREDVQAAIEAAAKEHEVSERLYNETLKTRQDAQSPVCTVEFQWHDNLQPVDHKSPYSTAGGTSRDEFWSAQWYWYSAVSVVNHGPGPALVTVPPPATHGRYWEMGLIFSQPVKSPFVVQEGTHMQFLYTLVSPGKDWAVDYDGKEIWLHVETRSLVTAVSDEHSWSFVPHVAEDDPLTEQSFGVEARLVADQRRTYPQDFG